MDPQPRLPRDRAHEPGGVAKPGHERDDDQRREQQRRPPGAAAAAETAPDHPALPRDEQQDHQPGDAMGDGRPPPAGRPDRDRGHAGPEDQQQGDEEGLVGDPSRGRPQDLAEPARSPGSAWSHRASSGDERYSLRYTLRSTARRADRPALTDCQALRACWMRGAHLRGGPGERPVPDRGNRGRNAGRGRTAHGRGPLRRGAAPHALPGRHAPAPGRRRASVRRRPCAARRRHPRQRGQPARRDGAALRLRCPAAVADLGPGRPTAHHRAAGLRRSGG